MPGYLISDTLEGGLLERGAYSQNEDIYDGFLVLIPHILRIQRTILPVKYINSTHSPSKNYQNKHASLSIEIYGKFLVISGIFDI